MRIHLICLFITFLPLIQYSITQRYHGYRGRERYDPDYDQDYIQNYAKIDDMDNSPDVYKAGKGRNIVEKAIGFVSAKAKALVKLIRCVLQCFVKYFISNYCNRMFPCLYDCSIGQTYIAPEVEAQLKSAKAIYPRGFELADIYKAFKCILTCATERPVKDWATFAAVLYCLADTCICFNIFGSGM